MRTRIGIPSAGINSRHRHSEERDRQILGSCYEGKEKDAQS